MFQVFMETVDAQTIRRFLKRHVVGYDATWCMETCISELTHWLEMRMERVDEDAGSIERVQEDSQGHAGR